MKQRISNPIRYEGLEADVPVKLDRYLRKVISATTERWYISCLYKPITWCRAPDKFFGGSHASLWYRPTKNWWTAINSPLITESERTINDGMKSVR